jgi:opacity protein-like surface antigen
MRYAVLSFLLAMPSFAASPVIFGARGGASINNNSVFGALPVDVPTRQYAIGPTIGVRLPLGFSVEGDALYNRQSLNLGGVSNLLNGVVNTHSDSWEFPVMLKFAAGRHAIAPVVGAGVSVRHINNFGSVPSYLFSTSTSNNNVGFVAAAGVRCALGPVYVTPEVRFTRWNGSSFTQSLVDTVLGSQNQAQVLVGFTF